MSKFVQGMSSVSKLDIWVQGQPNVYDYSHRVNHELRPVFHNLVYLDTSLEDIGLIGWKNLLLSMQCFPNLSQLEVYHKMGDDLPLENMNWCELDFVPDCLVRKLKAIKIFGLKRVDDELKLLAYILSNAVVLKGLHVSMVLIPIENLVNIDSRMNVDSVAPCSSFQGALQLERLCLVVCV
uniref:FBD domain-containing protein n=1 Tax=Chenopodium quinoa TaxID=63459 RepID=A0A803LYX8_CHEQI